MRPALRVMSQAAPLLFAHLPRLVVLSVAWLVGAWPLVTLGAVTLVGYAWVRRVMREEPPRRLGLELRRLWWPGTVWWAVNAALAALLYVNVAFWSGRLDGLAEALLLVVAAYLAWLWLALQPYLLDALADGVKFRSALSEAGRIVLAFPLYAHACALPVLALLALGGTFRTLLPLVGAGVVLAYWSCVAVGDPRPQRDRRLEELL